MRSRCKIPFLCRNSKAITMHAAKNSTSNKEYLCIIHWIVHFLLDGTWGLLLKEGPSPCTDSLGPGKPSKHLLGNHASGISTGKAHSWLIPHFFSLRSWVKERILGLGHLFHCVEFASLLHLNFPNLSLEGWLLSRSLLGQSH